MLKGNAGNDRILLGDAARVIANDVGDLFLGEMLGRGIARQVYAMNFDRTRVVKIETANASFQNVLEWTIWEALGDHKPSAAWLAPCYDLSDNGTVLIQARTDPIRTAELPAEVPFWLTDLKADNFGKLNGRVVCHDYSLCASVLLGRGVGGRMRRVTWEDGWAR